MTCNYYLYFKRISDIVISAVALIALSMPMALIGLLIYIEDGNSVLFCQKRIGKNGTTFVMYKFRTMSVDAPANLSCSEMAKQRCFVTRVGHVLRRFSLDELPQLFNVLKGDMSLIGPRPLIPEENEIHQVRLERGVYRVRPGLTGIAQIRGRNSINNIQKVEYDCDYIASLSFKEDMDIFFETIPMIFTGKGITKHECNNALKLEKDTCLRKAI